jgi:hypothetical protein
MPAETGKELPRRQCGKEALMKADEEGEPLLIRESGSVAKEL